MQALDPVTDVDVVQTAWATRYLLIGQGICALGNAAGVWEERVGFAKQPWPTGSHQLSQSERGGIQTEEQH